MELVFSFIVGERIGSGGDWDKCEKVYVMWNGGIVLFWFIVICENVRLVLSFFIFEWKLEIWFLSEI